MSKDTMKWVELVATLLVVVGALNWGLIGLLGQNLLEQVLASQLMVLRVVYILVGVSGLWLLYDWWMGMSKK